MNEHEFRAFFEIPNSIDTSKPPRLLHRIFKKKNRKLPPTVEAIFQVGGFGVYNTSELTFLLNGTVLQNIDYKEYSVDDYFPGGFRSYMGKEAANIREAFQALQTHLWPDVFEEPDDYFTIDGTQWNLTVRYNGTVVHQHGGSNAYPSNWEEVTTLFGIS